MGNHLKGKIERAVREKLKETGLPWSIEINGSGHKRVILAGKNIGTICLEDQKSRDDKQIMSKIRQRLRELAAQ